MADVTVWAGMATLSNRVDGRQKAIESILPQVDSLVVSQGDNIGDRMKLAGLSGGYDYYFTIDDDLVYPPNYVSDTLFALKQYPGCIVTYGGWSIDKDGEVTDYYRSLIEVDEDHQVHVGHSASMAFDRHMPFNKWTFQDSLYIDLTLAIRAHVWGIPIIVLKHSGDYFQYTKPETTIWDETQNKTGSFLDVSGPKAELLETLRKTIYGV